MCIVRADADSGAKGLQRYVLLEVFKIQWIEVTISVGNDSLCRFFADLANSHVVYSTALSKAKKQSKAGITVTVGVTVTVLYRKV